MDRLVARTARALLGMSQEKLAQQSLLSWTTVSAFESGRAGVSERTKIAIMRAVREAGIVFYIDDDAKASFLFTKDAVKALDPSSVAIGQLRAARVLLDWGQRDLAKHANLAISTVNAAEAGDKLPRPLTMRYLFEALINAGIEFVPMTADLGPGLRIKTELLSPEEEADES